MLCSHKKKFIYFKTKKTAGTSVEIFFEKFCVLEDSHRGEHDVKETITEAGIVGSRMKGRSPGDIFHNHMSAAQIRAKLGVEIFNSYYKFCVIRNPFDKCVSRFWWNLRGSELKRRILTIAPFAIVRRNFREFVSSNAGRLVDDRHVYMIDNAAVMDRFVRFENLLSDLKDVSDALGIEFTPESLGTYKRGYRSRQEHYSDYYDADTRRIVEREFDWEISQFGYTLGPEGSTSLTVPGLA